MDIISIVNTMQPDTIAKLALKAEDFHGEPSIPFMGAFVQLFPNATLPAESVVSAYQATYDAMVTQARADAQAKAALPDVQTQLANLTAALVTKGTLAHPDIDSNTLTAINASLEASGKAIIK